jgi:hypothetical protein
VQNEIISIWPRKAEMHGDDLSGDGAEPGSHCDLRDSLDDQLTLGSAYQKQGEFKQAECWEVHR